MTSYNFGLDDASRLPQLGKWIDDVEGQLGLVRFDGPEKTLEIKLHVQIPIQSPRRCAQPFGLRGCQPFRRLIKSHVTICEVSQTKQLNVHEPIMIICMLQVLDH